MPQPDSLRTSGPQPEPHQSTERNEQTDPTAAYERRDVDVRGILWLGGAVALGTLLIAAGLWGLLGYYGQQARRSDPQISPLAATDQLPPAPRLQSTPLRDYQQFVDEQTAQLDSYGWVDRGQGVVHIPVARAMDLILERGLPAPSPQTEDQPADAVQPPSPEDPPEAAPAKEASRAQEAAPAQEER